MTGKLRLTLFALVLLSVSILPAFGQDIPVSEIRGRTMGTTYLIKFQFRKNPADERSETAAVQQKVDQRLGEINRSMSTYIDDSEISRLNRFASTEAFSISTDFRNVASRALELNQLTLGRFDVTVGPLVRFWGFGGGMAPAQIPSQADVDEVLKRIGSSRLKIDESGIRKTIANLEVDFSAIAKGYAVDEICAVVKEYADHYMVEIGGEVRTSGFNPESGKHWAIGVELPVSDALAATGDLAARIELADQAMATSGDYRNVVVIDGKKFQHTIDPVTGFPVDQGILSVSVVARDCMTADGLATGLMVHKLETIQSICQDNDLGVFVIYRDSEGMLNWWKSEKFAGKVLMDENPKVSQKVAGRAESNPLYLILGTVIVFGLAISGMAIGVIMSNRQLKGSCGGLSAMSENGDGPASPCSLCTKPASECSKRSEQESSETPAEV